MIQALGNIWTWFADIIGIQLGIVLQEIETPTGTITITWANVWSFLLVLSLGISTALYLIFKAPTEKKRD